MKALSLQTLSLAGAALLALSPAAPVQAQSAGDWTVGVGIANVAPVDNPGTLEGGLKTSIGKNARPTLTVEYFIKDNLGIEILAATPFKHDIKIDGLGRVGTVKQLPPVISLQAHFDTNTPFKPFLGVGVNWTSFFSEKSEGALAGSKLDVKHSFGLALHAGTDYQINERSALRADIRWIDINSDVHLNGKKIGKVEVDPLVVGASYVVKF
ncbi:OmpW family outer membrane protein [Paracoccus cavernae]|uniref:OmpW family outer membrane protein n=1 Tax=Paracoccus cavernae TaxID=1571207 RepID=A0ABT8D544_9RHOB|nr:OmpW family outer membrane protein [Paracoccus cavernae]